MKLTSHFLAVCLALAPAAQGQLVGGLLNLTETLLVDVTEDLTTDISALLHSLGPAPDNDPRFTDFRPAGSNDSRSPCPGLNALANHGFLNRDGRNITIPGLLVGLAEGLNVGPDFTILIGALGLLSSPAPLLGSFDLSDLDQHDFPIEHDGSLSRQDAYYGNDYSFYNPHWQQVLSFYDGLNVTNTKQASLARYHRINDSLTHNPEAVYGLKEFLLSSGETGLYVQTMSNPINSSAPIAYIKTLFEEEKLPYELGWRPSSEPVNLLTLGAYILDLFAENPDAVAEGAELTVDSYADLVEVLIGGSEVLGNLTNGISKVLGF